MYQLIRRVHLFTALFLMTFVVMYFATGYPMIHEELIADHDPDKKTRAARLKYKGEKTPEAYALYLQEAFDLAGKRLPPQKLEDGRWQFRYFRPGYFYEAVVSAAGDSVRITEGKEHLRRTLRQFHTMHGYGGGWLYDAWVACFDLASGALVLFALSGIYMWYKLTQKRLLGWLLLLLSFGYAAATMGYLVYAP